MRSLFALALVAIAACTGCPPSNQPPPQGPIVVVAADGATQTVSTITACATISKFCLSVDAGTCTADLDGLVANAPVDLVDLTNAMSKTQLQTGGPDGGPIVGLGTLCQ